MSISSTVKKVMPYLKTASGYVLHRLSSQVVEMDDGTTLEQKVTSLNSLISNKVDMSDVVNNCLTTEEGFVLDARQGKIIDDKITELNGNKISKYNVSLAAGEVLTGETFAGKPVYMRLVGIGALPNNTQKTVSTGITGADYVWIDPTYGMAFNAGASYPLPYNDPSDLSNGITARLTSSGALVIVHTGSNWSGYSAYVAIKYTKQ